MTATVITRWEELRAVVDGPKSHRQRVAAWLATRAAVLYWGDSWFSTPLYPNLARQSAARIDGLRMIIGKPGALASSLLSDTEIARLCDRIKGNPFDTLCVSAGGNDALSKRLEKVFAPWMKPPRAARLTPAQAFDRLVASGAFDRIRERYLALLTAVRRATARTRPHFRVVGHGYAPLCRIGAKGDLTLPNIGLIAILKDDVGPWLFGPMRHVLESPAEGAAFARLMLIGGFRDLVLEPCRTTHPDLFSYADFSTLPGLDDPALWYDEIHPTEVGFDRCAPRLNDVIRAALPNAKRPAVGGA